MKLTPVLALACCVSASALAGIDAFKVVLDPKAAGAAQSLSGRVIVSLIKSDAHLDPHASPLDAPFWDDIQPIFAADAELAPGGTCTIDSKSFAYPLSLDKLSTGIYRAQARFIANRTSSNWRDCDGNFFSDEAGFTIADAASTVTFTLTHRTAAPQLKDNNDVKLVEISSPLLTKFFGRDVKLRAGVVLPVGYDARKKYAAVYEVPGFGGTAKGAWQMAQGRKSGAASSTPGRLARSTFWIVLDPESPNGHTLFADSANNGPRGQALVQELIPALEKKFPLVAKPQARLLRGHSSGGWSTLWLGLTYPDTFGAVWSSSPDPVDFRKFQNVDIYAGGNFYRDAAGKPYCSYRRGGQDIMTIQQENMGEEILGTHNTSGQQWDSWLAVWGPKDAAGHPADLFDPMTGAIDTKIAEQFRPYDIAANLRKDPAKYGPLFTQRIRLVVGDADNFFLNEAVELLSADLDRIKPTLKDATGPGYIKVVKGGLDHGTIFNSAEIHDFPEQMLKHLVGAGLDVK